jgi:hypothetical protein
MTCAYDRNNAVIDLCCTLKNSFSIGNLAYTPYQVRTVEIYDSDPRVGSPTAIASYTPTLDSSTDYYVTYKAEIIAGVLDKAQIFWDKWYFVWESGETETSVVNDFNVSRVGEINLITKLRYRLKDNHPDLNKRHWNDTELEMFLEDAILDLNIQPPAFTDFSLDDWEANVPNWKGLIIEGGVIFSLIAQGIFNIGIEFSYNDNGISVSTSRSANYQSMANMILQSYAKKKERMKQQLYMNSTFPRALLSSPLTKTFRVMHSRIWRYR